jgi:fatty-acyl-CoA synthase
MPASTTSSFPTGILGVFLSQSERAPERTVLVVGAQRLTWAELRLKGDRMAAALHALGIRKGDRVGLLTPNSVSWYVFLYAAVRLGAVPVPFDPQMGEYEMAHLFDRVGVRVVLIVPRYRSLRHGEMLARLRPQLPDLQRVVVDGGAADDGFFMPFEALLESGEAHPVPPVPPLDREDSNIFFCTTGSTGMPKIVDVPCKMFDDSAVPNAARWGFAEGDRFLLSMPLYHFAGFGWGFSCLSAGGTIYYGEDFTPSSFLETIGRERVTTLLLTPTLAKILLTHPRFGEARLDSLREVLFTGEYLADALAQKFSEERGLRVVNALGMTETYVFLDWDSVRDRGTSANSLKANASLAVQVRNAQGAECAPNEEGVIHVLGPVMKRYFRLPEVTRETIDAEGWLCTGDLGVRDESGRIRFVGRRKRVIKRGSNLVSPEEIEQFLRTHPACAAVVIDSEPDPLIGERIIAHVQPAEGKTLTNEELVAFCRNQISAYKVPDEFRFMQEVPTTVGKANPTLLRKSAPRA